MFRNTLTANDKYPVGDSMDLLSPIEIQLSLKPTIFSDFFFPFLESTSIFKHLKKKMILIPCLFMKLDTAKELVRPLFKKHRYRNAFDSQHIKRSQTLVKSLREHFYQIF